MKTYKTENNTIIKKIGRQKKIFFNNQGAPYFMWNNTRQYFDNIPRLSYPTLYTDENGKTGAIGGYIPLGFWGGVLVEILENSETVQLWNEITI